MRTCCGTAGLVNLAGAGVHGGKGIRHLRRSGQKILGSPERGDGSWKLFLLGQGKPEIAPLPGGICRAWDLRRCSGMKFLPGFAWLALGATALGSGQRIDQEGRILGAPPVVTQPILFDTAAADAVVSAMQIMPVTNPWNENVSQLPLLADSGAMIAQIMSDLASSRQTLRAFFEMNYVLAPDTQPTQSIYFFNYPGESDLNGGVSPYGLYPIPANLPIETWPIGTGTLTLTQWQEDVNNQGGDRHSITVQPGVGYLWETWETQLVSGAWQASNGAMFNLNSNALRPEGWTSGDAAGLQMFPALVRYDECERGMVEHAVRLVVARTRVGPIYPATHQASVGNSTNPDIPAMGQRIRLKASYVIPSIWTIEEKAVCRALKKYGGLVADNGGFFSFSVCPDDRFPANAFADMAGNSGVPISEFEVVQSTGAFGGPRSPGAPTVSAGTDQSIPYGSPAALQGVVTTTGPAPVVQWTMYSGPGTVMFGNAAQPVTTATFSQPGDYVLEIGANDSVHAVAYDAITVHVTTGTAANAPTALTGSASGIGTSTATLNGTVNPNGEDTSATFQYGLTTSYTGATAAQDIGSGTSALLVNAPLGNLAPGTLYHFQVTGSNSQGITPGGDQTFMTGYLFSRVAGRYGTALSGSTNATSGLATVSVTPGGAFTAVVEIAGRGIVFRGRFQSDGSASVTKSGFTLELQFGAANLANVINGNVTPPAPLAPFRFVAREFNTKRMAPAEYTVRLTRPSDTTLPQGFGYGAMTVGRTGAIRVAGKLGDGTTFAASAGVLADNTWILYAPLYGKQGCVAGTMTFETTVNGDFDGSVTWIKPATTGPYTPESFTTQVFLYGSQYSRPAKGHAVISFTSGAIEFLGGGLPANPAFASMATLNGANKFVYTTTPPPNGLTISISTANGLFSGSFKDPATEAKRRFYGAVFQDSLNFGLGVFQGTTEAGSVDFFEGM